MNYIRGAVSAISAPYQYYKDINPSTLTGAIDVIVIKRPADNGDGDLELICSPFHVRFGKLQVLRPAEKKVNVSVNGFPIPFNMKIGDAGEAFFVFETEGEIPDNLVTSPILSATTSSQPDIDNVPIDSFGDKQHEHGSTQTANVDMQEPEFLDLNATPSKNTNKPSGLSLSKPTSPSSPPPPTNTEIPSLISLTGTQLDILNEIDGPLTILDNHIDPPEVLYQSDMALDISGYHSHDREASDQTVTEVSESTRGSGSSPRGIVFHTGSPPQTNHGSTSHRNISPLKATFPMQRATSEPPPDLDDEELKHQRSLLRGSTSDPVNAALNLEAAPPRIHAPSISAPAITPLAGKEPQPLITELDTALRENITAKQTKYAKTLRLSSDQLKSLNLKPGANKITFSLTTSGAPACSARIFLWDSTDLVVVSDIDGTITKSDGLGHVFALIGRDWTHLGVAKLYTDITRNGYKIMYLTSRAIGQADSTRDYIKGIKQNEYQLPDGPVIMSPDRLMASLHREVIMRKPEVFKMACLRDIQRLFGDASRTPFYAGFGNRITDALSYRSVNVPSARIFTIDPTGEVKMELLELAGYKSSYIHMTDLVDQMFPPINRKWAPGFTDFNYWKTPVREFALPDLTPPSPALSARSDTSNRSTLARLRNFSLVGSRQSNMKQLTIAAPATERPDRDSRGSHLRQMSSLERISSTFASFKLSSSSAVGEHGMSVSPASRSSSSTFLDSSSDDGEDGDGDLKPRRRLRSRSITSMPGSLDDMHFDDEEVEEAEGYAYEYGGVEPGNAEEAAEEAFDEDFFATGEMKKVPFL